MSKNYDEIARKHGGIISIDDLAAAHGGTVAQQQQPGIPPTGLPGLPTPQLPPGLQPAAFDQGMLADPADPRSQRAGTPVDILKAFIGLPEDMSQLKNMQPPSLGQMLNPLPLTESTSPLNPFATALQAIQTAKGMGSSMANAPRNLGLIGDEVPSNYQVGQGLQGATTAATLAYGGVQAGKAILPSTKRAGVKFDAVMRRAKNEPLDLWAAGNVVVRADELAKAGQTLPKVFRDYMKHEGGMTYETGRDFASAAGRLSAAETRKLTPQMQAQVNKLAASLKTANREAAVKAGVGHLYDDAMREYMLAMKGKDWVAFVKRVGVKAALGAAGLYGVNRIVNQ